MKLPNLNYPCGIYVPFSKLGYFDKKHVLNVESCILTSFVHSYMCGYFNRSGISDRDGKKIGKIYSFLYDRLYGKKPLAPGKSTQMTVGDIMLIGDEYWPTTAISLTADDIKTLRKRDKEDGGGRKFIEIGTSGRVAKFLTLKDPASRVWFDTKTKRLACEGELY